MILAAGEATRMGLPKPALPYESTTMIGSVVNSAGIAGLRPIVVVTGFHSQEVNDAVGDSARIVHNPEPELGNMSSLLVGIDAAGEVDGVVVLLADMPGIRGDVVADLVDGVVDSGSRCGWVEYTDGRGHPIVLSRSIFDDVQTLTGTKALWPFFLSIPESDVFILHVNDPRPTDVNTPDDYTNLTRRTQVQETPRAFLGPD